jgi:GNAT superfamily N-acetyltransferase
MNEPPTRYALTQEGVAGGASSGSWTERPMRVKEGAAADRPAVDAFLAVHGAARVARRGELVDVHEHPVLVAEDAGGLEGILTYVVEGDRCEILTLHVVEQRRGAGTALIKEVERVARTAGCRHLWLITTNDNVDGLRFYQRRGFRLASLHPGAVDRSRATVKPEIPEIGDHGIPLRDEIELRKDL